MAEKQQVLLENQSELKDKNNDGLKIDDLIAKIQEDGKVDNAELRSLYEQYIEEKEKISDEDKNRIKEYMGKITEDLLVSGIKIGPDIIGDKQKFYNFIDSIVKYANINDGKSTFQRVLELETKMSLKPEFYNSFRDKAYVLKIDENTKDLNIVVDEGDRDDVRMPLIDTDYLDGSSNAKFEGSISKKEELGNNDVILNEGNNLTIDVNGEDSYTEAKILLRKEKYGEDYIDDESTQEEKTPVEEETEQTVEKEPVVEVQKVEESIEKENSQDKMFISWNKKEFSKDGIKLIQEKIGTKVDGDFGPNSLKKLKLFLGDEKDLRIGLGVLKKLGLVDENNNAIGGLTKEMFNEGQLEKGNSKNIKFLEKLEESSVKSEDDKVKPVEIENEVCETEDKTSILDKASESLKSGSQWLKEVFTLNKELQSFIGKNGRDVKIEFNEASESFDINTGYFDGVSDSEMKALVYKLEGINDIKTLDQAKTFAENNLKAVKEMYDTEVSKNVLNSINKGNFDKNRSYTVSTFENQNGELMDVRLIRSVDQDGKFKELKVQVATEFGDGISDSETSILLTKDDSKEITQDMIDIAVKDAKTKYETLLDVQLTKKAQESENKAKEELVEEKQKAEEEAADKKMEEDKEKAEKIKDLLENKKINIKDLFGTVTIGSPEAKWLSEFGNIQKLNDIEISINNIDLENNIINFDFDDAWGNEDFNKGLEIKGAINSDGVINLDTFHKSLPEKAREAVKKMLDKNSK